MSTEQAVNDANVDDVSAPSAGSQIAVIAKAGQVLDVLLESAQGATPTDVAMRMGITRSTAFRLLTSLEKAGLVDRDADSGRYRLGIRLLLLGDAVRDRMDLVSLADPVLRSLRDEVRQSVYLSRRDGWGAMCLHRMAGPDVDVLAWKAGQWLPFHIGAGPRALLAALSDDEIDRYLAQGSERRTRQEQLTDEQIWAIVRRTRARGWSLNLEELTEGVSSLGAVVRGAKGLPLCAISVAGLTASYQGTRLDTLAAAVTATADQLSRQVAGFPDDPDR